VTGPGRPSPAFLRALAAILAGALAVRLLYTIAVAGNELSPGPAGDFVFYHQLANLIADGHGFVSPFRLEQLGRTAPTAEHPPLWPLLLAGGSKLGGNGLLAHRLVGVPVGVAVVAVLALIGRRVGGERAGLAVAAIAAAHPLLIAADGSLMSETLFGLWVALGLLAALRLLERPAPARAAWLGAAVGLAALTRGEGLLLVPLLALPAAWAAARPPGRRGLAGGAAASAPARRRGLALAVAAVAATVLVLAPWLVRNWTTFDRPVLTSTNDGTVLTGANCDRAYHGRDLGFWRVDCRSPLRDPNEARQSATWRDEGLDHAGDHAGRLVTVVIPVRLLRTWDLWQPDRQVDLAEGRDPTMERLGAAVYFLLLPLAVAGAIALRRRGGPLWVLLTPVALVTIVSVTAYGYTRFRHPADLALVVLAGLALARLSGAANAARAGGGCRSGAAGRSTRP
jgi:4-amino-4-deoxy-L-arabinose transferase-like glycosyltransferase